MLQDEWVSLHHPKTEKKIKRSTMALCAFKCYNEWKGISSDGSLESFNI